MTEERIKVIETMAFHCLDCIDAKKELIAEVRRLRESLRELVEAVTAEANEKGAGGYLLARLSDARAALASTASKELE